MLNGNIFKYFKFSNSIAHSSNNFNSKLIENIIYIVWFLRFMEMTTQVSWKNAGLYLFLYIFVDIEELHIVDYFNSDSTYRKYAFMKELIIITYLKISTNRILLAYFPSMIIFEAWNSRAKFQKLQLFLTRNKDVNQKISWESNKGTFNRKPTSHSRYTETT